MRYVLIVMLLFSASAQAEDWESFGAEDSYYSKSDTQFNLLEQTISVKMLIDNVQGASAVQYFQFRCADGKPVKERSLYMLRHEGRMGTGNRSIIDAGGPWMPFRSLAFQYLLGAWCRAIEDQRNLQFK